MFLDGCCLAVEGLAVVSPVVVGYAVAAEWGPMWALSLGVLGDGVMYLSVSQFVGCEEQVQEARRCCC